MEVVTEEIFQLLIPMLMELVYVPKVNIHTHQEVVPLDLVKFHLTPSQLKQIKSQEKPLELTLDLLIPLL